MKKNYFLLLCSLLLGVTIQAQVSYTGNGNGGFGGTVGGSTLNISDDGTTITFAFSRGTDLLSNAVVIYIDSKSGGFSDTSGFTDSGDGLRTAISTTNNSGNNPSVTFPSGFTADYAIAFDSGFGGWFTLVNGGSHTYGSDGTNGSANLTPTSDSSAATHTLTVDFSELGITATDKFDFVVTYIATSSWLSDEVIGDTSSITAGTGAGVNPGPDGSITFSDSRSYPNTWTGATNNDWATAGNWTEGVPGTTHNVYIPSGLTNYPTASSAITVNKAIIKSGASIINESTFSGTVTIERDLATTNWYLLSTPVTGESKTDMIANNDFDNTTSSSSNIGFSFYDNTQASNQWTYATAATTGSLFDTGYGVKLNNAGTVTISGNLRSGGANVSESIGSSVTNFNLIGNVFQAYLAANENADATNSLLNTNNGKLTENTIWLWDQAQNSYTQINQASSAFHIAPMQGFFVSVSSNQSFTYPTASRSHQSSDSFQKSATTRPEIKLMLSDGTTNRDTDIYYIDGKTTGFDNGYDSSIFGGVNHEFIVYTESVANNDGKRLGIQSLPNQDYENMVIPVGVKVAAGKEITFTADAMNLPEGIKVFLEDRENNSFNELSSTNNYKVTVNNALNGTGRFFLHTRSSALSTDDIALTGIGMYALNKNTLRISGVNSTDASVKVFNILGSKVVDKNFASKGVYDVSLPNLNTGVYIVQLSTEKGKLSKKIVLE